MTDVNGIDVCPGCRQLVLTLSWFGVQAMYDIESGGSGGEAHRLTHHQCRSPRTLDQLRSESPFEPLESVPTSYDIHVLIYQGDDEAPICDKYGIFNTALLPDQTQIGSYLMGQGGLLVAAAVEELFPVWAPTED